MPKPRSAGSSDSAIGMDDGFCKLCRRSRGSPNPLTSGPLSTFSTLPFKSSKAALCTPCRNYSALCDVEEVSTLVKKLLQSEKDFDAYMEGLSSYERSYNNNASGRAKKAEIKIFETSLSSSSKAQILMTENLGILWPLDLHKRLRGDYKKEDIVQVRRRGEKILGIVLDETQGFPIGAIRLEKTDIEEIVQKTDLCSSSSDAYKGLTIERFKKATSRLMDVTPSSSKEGAPATFSTSEPVKKKRRASGDSSSSCNWLDYVPEPCLQMGGDDDAEHDPPAKRQRKSSSARGSALKNTKKARVMSSTPSKQRNKQLERQIKELNLADKAIADCEQHFCMLKTARTFKLIQEKQLRASLKRLDGRLEPKVVEMYTYVIGSDDEGCVDSDEENVSSQRQGPTHGDRCMNIVPKLRTTRDKLQAMTELVSGLTKQGEDPPSTIDLLGAWDAVQNSFAREEYCSYPAEMLLRRVCRFQCVCAL